MQTLVHMNQSNGYSHKEQNKQRKIGSFRLPSLREGNFYLGEGPGGAESHDIWVPAPEPSLI